VQVVIAPASPLRTRVLQERLQPVHGVGKTGVRGLLRLELVPQRAHARRLVRRKQAKDALGRRQLPLFLRHEILRVVGEGVAGIDLDEIVNGEHFEHV
jgi:hypothetical protein